MSLESPRKTFLPVDWAWCIGAASPRAALASRERLVIICHLPPYRLLKPESSFTGAGRKRGSRAWSLSWMVPVITLKEPERLWIGHPASVARQTSRRARIVPNGTVLTRSEERRVG